MNTCCDIMFSGTFSSASVSLEQSSEILPYDSVLKWAFSSYFMCLESDFKLRDWMWKLMPENLDHRFLQQPEGQLLFPKGIVMPGSVTGVNENDFYCWEKTKCKILPGQNKANNPEDMEQNDTSPNG